MTTHDDGFDRTAPELDRLLTSWLDADARIRTPETLLDRTLARTSRQRPLPAWRLLERWLPMELTMRRTRVPRALPYALLLAALLLLVVVALAIVGSQRRVPPPFGPARNGEIAYVTDGGDVATMNPVTGVSTTIVTSPERERYPVFSLDGTRIAFIRPGADGDHVYVVDPATRVLTRLTSQPLPTSGSTGLLTWSPDGTQLALQSDGNLWVARTDGTDAHRIDLGFPIDHEIEWRPPDGREMVVRSTQATGSGLFLLPADGSGPPRAITPIDGGDNDYLWLSWSPDGGRLAYHLEGRREVHVLTIGDAHALVLKPIDGTGLMFPRFSPDGSRLAVMAWNPDGTLQVGVVPADDPTPAVTRTGPTFGTGIQFDWSPDGSQILVVGWDTDEPWILDPAGGPGQRTTWSIAVPDWVEWQRLAR